jgi:hypothetical protein
MAPLGPLPDLPFLGIKNEIAATEREAISMNTSAAISEHP